LGEFVLKAWIEQDLRPRPREEAEQAAMEEAKKLMERAASPPRAKKKAPKTLEEHYAQVLPPALEEPADSATSSKGILSLVAACGGANIVPLVTAYLQKWHCSRAPQSRALLQLLASLQDSGANEALLSAASTLGSKSLRDEAQRLARPDSNAPTKL
jgi:hypothetical protein